MVALSENSNWRLFKALEWARGYALLTDFWIAGARGVACFSLVMSCEWNSATGAVIRTELSEFTGLEQFYGAVFAVESRIADDLFGAHAANGFGQGI